MSNIGATSAYSQSPLPLQTAAARLRAPVRLTLNDTSCAWAKSLQSQLERLVRLPVGWDGYRGKPVSLPSATFLLTVLDRLYSPRIPEPHLVPGYNGDVQAEWHGGGVDIELHVRQPNDVIAWRQTAATQPDGEEIPLVNDFTVVGTWITELADALDADPAAAA